MSTDKATEATGWLNRLRGEVKLWYLVPVAGWLVSAGPADMSLPILLATFVVAPLATVLSAAAYRRLVERTGYFGVSERRWQLVAAGGFAAAFAGGFFVAVVGLTLLVGLGGWVLDWVRADPGTGDAATV